MTTPPRPVLVIVALGVMLLLVALSPRGASADHMEGRYAADFAGATPLVIDGAPITRSLSVPQGPDPDGCQLSTAIVDRARITGHDDDGIPSPAVLVDRDQPACWSRVHGVAIHFYTFELSEGDQVKIWIEPISIQNVELQWYEPNYRRVIRLAACLDAIPNVCPTANWMLWHGTDGAPADRGRLPMIAPGTYGFAVVGVGAGSYSIWVESQDDPIDTLAIEERFSYPPAFELGATVFREFRIRDNGSDPWEATDVTARLEPVGSCATLAPGRLRCAVPTESLPLGPAQFRFASARHGTDKEDVSDWPLFEIRLEPRENKTKAQATANSNVKGAVGAYLQQSNEAALSIELPRIGPVVVESARSAALGGGFALGVGAGVSLGVVNPRVGISMSVGDEVKLYQNIAIALNDPTTPAELRAAAAFVLSAGLEASTFATPAARLLVDKAGELLLRDSYQRFVTKDEMGVALSVTGGSSGGVFAAQRTSFDPFNFGLGVGGSWSVGVGWSFDERTSLHALNFRADLKANVVATPNGLLTRYFIGEERLLLPDFAGAGVAGLVVKASFKSRPTPANLTALAFELSAGGTFRERLLQQKVTLTFSGDGLRAAGGQLWADLEVLFDPESNAELSVENLLSVLERALAQVKGEIKVEETQGSGFGLTFALGAEVGAIIHIELSGEIGGEWTLGDTQTTQRWRIEDGELYQLSEFAFTPTPSSEQALTDLVTDALIQALSDIEVGDVVSGLVTAGEALVQELSTDLTQATVRIDGGVARTYRGGDGQPLGSFELAARFFGGGLLRAVYDGLTGTGASPFTAIGLGSQSAEPRPFIASEYLQLEPGELTIEPAIELEMSYVDAFAGDSSTLRIYRFDDDGTWRPMPSTVDEQARTVTAEIDALGAFVVGLDETPPAVSIAQITDGLLVVLSDDGSGIDPESVTVAVDGDPVEAEFDPQFGTVRVADLGAGSLLVLTVRDGAGNVVEVEHEVPPAVAIEAAPLPSAASTPAAQSTTEAATASPTAAPAVQATAAPAATFESPADGSSSGLGALLIVAIVLAVAAGGGGVYAWRRRSRT